MYFNEPFNVNITHTIIYTIHCTYVVLCVLYVVIYSMTECICCNFHELQLLTEITYEVCI